MKNSINKLNLYLANLNVLYRKVQNYHWNVTGNGFYTIHSKLEEFYDNINEQIDTVAERILALGARPLGTMKDYLEISTIKEAKNEEITGVAAITKVKEDFENMLALVKEIKEVADEEKDYATSAMVDEYITNYEKDLWMISAYLK